MSWKTAFQYAKGVAANHGVDCAKKEERADNGLPLGARIGGVFTMQMSPLIRANAGGSLVKLPTNSDTVIQAISRIRLNLDGKLHRFYLEKGDDYGSETFIQVYSNAKGEIAELLYCTHLTRFIPETEEDQSAFTGSNGTGLGQQYYSLWREQIASLGVDELTLSTVFGDGEEIKYLRDIGDSSQEFISPLTGTETRIDDSFGEHGLKQQIYFMPYARALATGGQEYLVITTEIVESRDGDASKRSIHVDFMIGIPLEPERVSVQ